MIDATEQPVVETPDAEAVPAVEENSAQDDDLDALLKEFEGKGETEIDEPEAKADGELDTQELLKYVEEQRRAQREREMQDIEQQTEADIQSAVKMLKDGVETELPDEFWEGYLYRAAAKDQRFLTAFQHRRKDPEKWAKVLKASQKKITEKLSIDRSVTDNKAAMISAVHGSKKAAPSQGFPTDLSSLSDAEFKKLMAKEMRET